MFSFFKNWNETWEKKFKKEKKWVEPLYFHNMPIKIEINELKSELGINGFGKKNTMLNAFYLGAIQGDFRQLIGVNGLDPATIFGACLDSAMYSAIKDGDIKDDGEFGALTQQYKECMTAEYSWFGNNGMNYALAEKMNFDRNQIWSDLLKNLEL